MKQPEKNKIKVKENKMQPSPSFTILTPYVDLINDTWSLR